jgi:tetratricopeptide (TPR) repeat protein
MRFRTFCLVLVALALSGCGSNPSEPGPPPDARLDQANRAGNQALSIDMPRMAARQYKMALQRAYERDDPAAIADVSYNLALALMRAGDANSALATVRDARLDLERRRATVPPELFLVQAAAAYRIGDLSGADTAAQETIAHAPQDQDAKARAWFIRGLVAAEHSDATGLAQAIAALGATKQSDLQADRDELLGRAALLTNQPAEALGLFERSATSRQQALDYRGMVRALSLAGDAALRAGRNSEAAVFLLRGGRSALLQGDSTTGLTLLKRAEELARETLQSTIVDEVGRLRKATAQRENGSGRT